MGKGRTGKGRVSPYSLGNAVRNIKKTELYHLLETNPKIEIFK